MLPKSHEFGVIFKGILSFDIDLTNGAEKGSEMRFLDWICEVKEMAI
jgi:hypothetical protein